ncbi:ECF transporter S component [Geobacillus stearothermophilus]|uniref:ECF transporter S component n=1 Tax=Geobacillus stearothermophilus TaxID=1422 RepID=UPI0006AC710C|nr:ECF transporter S component [Geobacillus stearothermophilus]KOR92370.1 riboflavin transporter FmnP [Geobacillus stearothermophilus ATCC 12980]MED3722254.1 ECF transporter S component [Geobacillus stearothermophilus]MED3747017.1 ECF transporter S component [Geobacillus stearothermophilus]MED3753034.1 ECF transporter S component [Geobacillus stearothermophilus]MED3769678.1 ECF transporter S component [Geobacillus stearothermophilus]
MKRISIRAFVSIGVLGAMAHVLMMLNFPLPPFPNFLLVDFSDIPALIAALLYGPLAGVAVELLKNVLNYVFVGSATGVPVGQIANFTAGVAFLLPVSYIYRKSASKKGLLLGLAAGTLTMALVMSVLNYYVFLPAYTLFLGAPQMSAPEAKALVVSAILPFNAVKGAMAAIVFQLLFWRLRAWLDKQAASRQAA